MGKHYVPQAHLRRFQLADKSGFVWMYDKKTRKFVTASISKVAQEDDFYSQEVEQALAKEIELPGNVCIDKLLRRESLDNNERSHLALYMMLMATRGPRQRRLSLERVPATLAITCAEIRREIEAWIDEDEHDVELAIARLKELDVVQKKFLEEPPQQVLDQARVPFWSARTVECLLNMAWHIVPAPSPMQFVTCDTPAHFFDCYGVGNRDSEFTFALSKEYALIGEHQRPRGTVYERPKAQLAKEVNRRTLSHAERFVFSARKEAWIGQVSQKDNPYLSRIVWR